MKKFPPIIAFRITSKCNNNCKYCFGPKNIKEMDFIKLKELFFFFYKQGVKAILLTGGEPLIRKDFDKIIKELKKYKFKIFLDTNGDLFFEHKKIISKYVDVIGLPIDFPDKSYRNKKNLEAVLATLEYFKKLKRRPLIRIGTVATRDNFKKLREIGKLLKDYPVDIWKIYQFLPQNINALKNRSFLEIPAKKFNQATKEIEDIFSRFFKVIISKRENRNRAYFFLDPDGTVFVPIDDKFDVCKQEKVGSIFDKDIIKKWRSIVSKDNYLDNALVTFNCKF